MFSRKWRSWRVRCKRLHQYIFIISPCDFRVKLRFLCNTQYGGAVSWKLFQTSYYGEFYNRGEVCCHFRSDKDKDVESYCSFMNLVWFQEGFGQWDTIADSCSITQSEESGFDQWFTYIQSQVRTKYESVKAWKIEDMHRYTRSWSCQIWWTSGYTTCEEFFTPACHRCKVH